MPFNSVIFLVFGLVFFSLWFFLKQKTQLRLLLIVVFSFVFYGFWDWRFLFLIVFSGLIDYLAAIAIYRFPAYRKSFFILSLIGNLGSLAIFKYSVFIASSIELILNKFNISLQLTEQIPEFALILPVGISFYTFQSMSYTIDVYRGRLNPTKNLLLFFAYLTMFPQLVAGPIVRAKDLLYQLNRYRKVSSLEIWNGGKLIVYGLFLKTVIADNISYLVDWAFEGNMNYWGYTGSLYWWISMIGFAVQIYCDFSGYSLIARGLAKWMGYHFKMNFNHPYLSTKLQLFWRNWHISLSTWFRDYVYIPLGGAFGSKAKMLLAIFITFILSGLWHGASINFIIWGGIHGLALILERLYFKHLPPFIKKYIYPFWTFIFVCFAWVFFRAETFDQALNICTQLFDNFQFNPEYFRAVFDSFIFLCLFIVLEISYLIYRSNYQIKKFYQKNHLDILSISLAILMILFFRGEGSQFIYFQF